MTYLGQFHINVQYFHGNASVIVFFVVFNGKGPDEGDNCTTNVHRKAGSMFANQIFREMKSYVS